MKRILPLLLLLLGACPAAAQQTEPPALKAVADRFTQLYNQGRYDSIFTLFAPPMAKAVPLEKTVAFLGGLKEDAGNLLGRKLTTSKSDRAGGYEARFERVTLRFNLSLDESSAISGFQFKPLEAAAPPTALQRNATPLLLPFKEAWTVVWGGDTRELNYHVESRAQRGAFDLVITDAKGQSYKTDGKTNADYYAFGKEILAPCAGEIVTVVTGVKDNAVPGEENSFNVGGNMVILKTPKSEYLVFCHLKHRSVRVKEGQQVKTGEVLGLCGNSGHSSEPHLHFHIQDVEDMNKATGMKCYFSKLNVNGQRKTNYSPVQNDRIRPE